jgi:hypothetical protein
MDVQYQEKQFKFQLSGKTGKYVHILLDISPSMEDKDVCPRRKIDVAKDILLAYSDRFISLNPNENFIRAWGINFHAAEGEI